VSGTALLDVDGTLVDIDYHHALAWSRASRRYDVTRLLWRIYRAIGMGGDTLVAHVAGQQVEDAHGGDLRDAGSRRSTGWSPRCSPSRTPAPSWRT
jgi:beta-phosphoglucomutase-like phosphatase (HAD superfamily)